MSGTVVKCVALMTVLIAGGNVLIGLEHSAWGNALQGVAIVFVLNYAYESGRSSGKA